jgi:hypothetical protein
MNQRFIIWDIILGEAIAIDPTKIEAIMEWSVPTNVHKVCSFMVYKDVDGSSKRFAVPIVQELASNHLLPERCIISEDERSSLFNTSSQIGIPSSIWSCFRERMTAGRKRWRNLPWRARSGDSSKYSE